MRGFELNGSGPFALFLNAAAETLGDAAERIPATRQTVVIEITEQALIATPDGAAAHADALAHPRLGRVARRRRRRLALAGADAAALSRRDQARPAPPAASATRRTSRASSPRSAPRPSAGTRPCSPRASTPRSSWRRRARVGATLGQGYLLGEPAPLPGPLPEPGRKLRLDRLRRRPRRRPRRSRRVTNWKRPTVGTRELAERPRRLIMRQALALGETAVVLAAPGRGHVGPAQAAELQELAAVARVRRRLRAPPELARSASAPARSRPTTRCAARGPRSRSARARRLLRRPRREDDELAARDLLRPRPGRGVRAAAHGAAAPARSASSLITFESWPPCQASGELPGSSERSSRARDRLRVALADRVRVLGVDLVAAGHDDGRDVDRGAARPTPRTGASAAPRAARRPPRRGARGRRAAGAARGRSSPATARARCGSP